MTAIAARPTSVRWRIVLLLMALCFISHFNRISMSVAGTERIIGEFGIDPERMGRVYFAFLLVYTVSMALGGYIIDRYGVRVALMFMAIGSGTFAAITGLVGLLVVTRLWLTTYENTILLQKQQHQQNVDHRRDVDLCSKRTTARI